MSMTTDTKMRAAGAAAVVVGVVLIGTAGLAFVTGWALWAAGLAAVLGAGSSDDGPRRGRRSPQLRVLARGRITAVTAT